LTADLTMPKPTGAASWRDSIAIHPATNLFPLLGDAELREVGEDIKKNGLTSPIAIRIENDTPILLDGRNRLDAMERVGLRVNLVEGRHHYWHVIAEECIDDSDGEWCNLDINQRIGPFTVTVVTSDPVAYIISANINRRNLTGEQKRELVTKVLKANPERSDRATAELVRVDHKTVGSVRRDLEARGDVPHVEKRVDTKGRKQPTSKPPKSKADRATTKPPKPKPGRDRLPRPRPLIEFIVHVGNVIEDITNLRPMSEGERTELMAQIARANAKLNELAIAVAISGGANLGKLSPPSLRYEALSFLHKATARIEAELADRDVREAAP
jgi:hypothetical protein